MATCAGTRTSDRPASRPALLLDDADCMHWPRAGGVMGDDYRYMYMYDNFLRKRL